MAIISYDKSPNISPEQRVKSLADSVRRAFEEIETPEGSSGCQGFFTLEVDASGNLWANYLDGCSPPPLEYDKETGNLYIDI